MGINSGIWVGYGFRIPKREFKNLLKWDYEEADDYIGDDIYTHEICDDVFMYGKVFYTTESRNYLWDGNREIVDLRSTLKIHHMQKKKIDNMAKRCACKATYFTIAATW